jgi:hypothetical protein
MDTLSCRHSDGSQHHSFLDVFAHLGGDFMLFIQSLDTYYQKEGRSSEYARLRTGDMFRRIDRDKIKECEVFAHLLSLRYDKDNGVSQAKPYSEKYKQYGKSIFTEGTRDRYKNYNELL